MAVDSLDGIIEEREERPNDLVYDGGAAPLAGIAITNTLLTLVTLGFYRFWGKTRLRRYLWSRISLEGDRLEYVGTGKELFIGFCIALLVFIPLVSIPAVAEIFLIDKPLIFAGVQIAYALIAFWLIQLAIFRARRYRLSRTKWRGIRAGQTGSAIGYAFRYCAWMLISLITLSMAFPWARMALQRYRVEHSWFGNQKFSFEAKGGALLAPWLLVALPALFGIGILTIAIIAQGASETHQQSWAYYVPPIFFFISAIMFIRYRVAEFRYFVSCTGFSRCRFSSDLHAFKVFLVFLVSAILAIGVFLAIGAGVFYVLGPSEQQLQDILLEWQRTPEDPSMSSDVQGIMAVMFFAWVILVAASLSVIRIAVNLHWMTRLICASLTISEVEEFVAVARSKAETPAFGEGLADAFDVGEIGF